MQQVKGKHEFLFSIFSLYRIYDKQMAADKAALSSYVFNLKFCKTSIAMEEVPVLISTEILDQQSIEIYLSTLNAYVWKFKASQ